jgi:hypothetical protein
LAGGDVSRFDKAKKKKKKKKPSGNKSSENVKAEKTSDNAKG